MSDRLSILFTQLHREHLKLRGFRKERYTFTRNAGPYVERFNFQGSAWSSAEGKRFYINLGIWFPEFADDTSGSGYFAGNHWASRIDRVVAHAPSHWDVDATTELSVLSEQLATLVEKASNQLAERIGTCRNEYLQRRAGGRAMEI